MDDLRLRRGTPADLEVVLQHRREMFDDMKMGGDFEAAEPLSRDFFGRAFAEGNYHAWFFEDSSGRIMAGGGVILVEYHPSPMDPRARRPWVVNVYVDPTHRRLGLARRLMDVMIEWTRKERYAHLLLHASNDGRPLYESMGFAATNEMRLKL